VADPADEIKEEAVAAEASAASQTETASENETDSAKEATRGDDAAGTETPGLNTNDIEKLLDQATESLDQAAGENVSTEAKAKPFSLSDLTPDSEDDERQPIDLLGEVEMDLRIELGRTQMRLEEVLQLRGGSVVALDKLAGDPVDVFVNGRLIARGEVLVMNDNFCIRVTELVGA
jgi:flagellar motor switch protein FliN/FliY